MFAIVHSPVQFETDSCWVKTPCRPIVVRYCLARIRCCVVQGFDGVVLLYAAFVVLGGLLLFEGRSSVLSYREE